MGGNMLGIGNCGQYAGEFNFYHDSESAKIVLDKYAQQVRSPPTQQNLRESAIGQ